MSEVATVQLTGDARFGVTYQPLMLAAAGDLPVSVKLGAILPTTRPQALRLENYIHPLSMVPPKAVVNWYSKSAGLNRMMANDRMGNCVIAGKAHLICAHTAEDPDSGGEVIATDAEVIEQYNRWKAGPGDSGCIIVDVLENMKSGFKAAGKVKKLKGYAAASWQNAELTKVGIDLFGGGTIGFRVPQGWLNSSVWSPQTATGPFVGGHDVSPLGYDEKGVYVSSWGRMYLMTWDAYTSSRWITEQYFLLFEDTWTGVDGRAPSGVDITTLAADMDKLKDGTIPPLPDPNPQPPPVPPSPPVPPPAPTHPALQGPVVLKLPLFGTVAGTVGPLLPVAAGAADAGADIRWFSLMLDVSRLIRAVQAKDWAAARDAAFDILADLGVNLDLALRVGEPSGLTVDVWTLIGHVGQLLEAVGSRNVMEAIAALRLVLADLGINLPF